MPTRRPLVAVSPQAQFVSSSEEDSYASTRSSEPVQDEPAQKHMFDESDEEAYGTDRVDLGLLATRKELAEAEKARSEGLQELRQAELYDPRADEITDVEGMKGRALRVLGVLADFARRRIPELSRTQYIGYLREDIAAAYGYSLNVIDILIDVLGPLELHSFVTACERPRPLTIRTNTLRVKRRDLAQMLISRGVNLDPVGDWCKEGLQVFSSQVPVGATPEYLRGYYIIQDAASFLPVIALQPQRGERVLDMASAPGGKTTHIAALMGNTGTLYANDSNKARIPALQANMARMGVMNAVVINYDARDLCKHIGGFDRILLDAPCSGLGVVSKDPSIKSGRDFKDLQRLSTLQRELLCVAVDLLNTDPRAPRVVCYSTCSISVAENEAVIDYVLRERKVEVLDLPFSFGYPGIVSFKGSKFHPSIKKARRFYPHVHNTHGFFVCLLRMQPK